MYRLFFSGEFILYPLDKKLIDWRRMLHRCAVYRLKGPGTISEENTGLIVGRLSQNLYLAPLTKVHGYCLAYNPLTSLC